MAAAGRKAAFAMEQRCSESGVQSLSARVRMFDVLVKTILGYGAKVWGRGYGPKWGWNGDGDQTEKVHRVFLRGLLRARKSTHLKTVQGEFDRFRLVVKWWDHIFKFTKQAESLPCDRLARLAFEESKDLWAAGCGGWFAKVVDIA